jgi:predicted MFS family arabinose efflux permease
MASVLNRPSAIGTMVVSMVVGAMFFLLMPMYIGALSDYAGFTNQQIGNLTFFELSGVALASLSSLFWIRRIDWRIVFGVSCASLVVSNALSILDHEFYWLIGTRILAGLGEGSLLCIGYAALGDTKEVDRNFGFSVIGQILTPALFFVMLPGWLSQYGLSTIFMVQLVCALLALLLVPLFPPAGVERDSEVSLFQIGRFPLLGLLGSMLYYIGVTAVWGFIERMGVEEGFASQEIANVLAVSLVASVFGAVLASVIGVRFTRHWPMVVSLAVQLIALMLLVSGMSFLTYAVAIIFYSLGWNLWMPYQLSSISQVDDSGRIMGIVPLAQAFGVSLGPLIAGQLLNGNDYLVINWMGAVTAVLALIVFLPVCKAAAKPGILNSAN